MREVPVTGAGYGDAMHRDSYQSFNDAAFRARWTRFLPHAWVILLFEVGNAPLTRSELEQVLLHHHSPNGFAGAVWDPLKEWTDDELSRMRDEFGDDEGGTATEINAHDRRVREERLEELRRYARHLDVAEVSTLGDLLTFCIAAGIIEEGNDGKLSLASVVPLPQDVLPLTEDERAAEDAARWSAMYEPAAQKIIALFHPTALARADRLTTSVAELAAEVSEPTETIREALQVLEQDGDFAIEPDVRRAGDDETVTVTVDWEEFSASRISIQRSTGDDDGSSD